jgi:hypothetical protein
MEAQSPHILLDGIDESLLRRFKTSEQICFAVAQDLCHLRVLRNWNIEGDPEVSAEKKHEEKNSGFEKEAEGGPGPKAPARSAGSRCISGGRLDRDGVWGWRRLVAGSFRGGARWRSPWTPLGRSRSKKLECGVDVFELLLRGILQLLVGLEAVRMPDLDEEAIGAPDLGFRGIEVEIEAMEGGAARTARAAGFNRISA